MSQLILHHAIPNPASRAVLMLCELIGVQLQLKDIHKPPKTNREDFVKLNPMGTLPVLQDGDFVLSDSRAIMKYLLLKYGGEKKELLYPSALKTRALVDQCMYFDAGMLHGALLSVARDTFNYFLEEPMDEHNFLIDDSYSILEAYLKDRKYVATNHLTIADLSNGSTATAIQALRKLDADKYPRCADWIARLEEEEVFKTINAPGALAFGEMFNYLWTINKNYNKNYNKNNK